MADDKKKVLIIEDDDSQRQAIVSRLTAANFDVIEASDGSHGLAKALTEFPDLIVLDIMMPVMNGKETLDKLRADEWGQDVPVLILSNLDLGVPYMAEMAEDDKNVYMTKVDSSLSDIENTVSDLLSKA